MPGFGGGFGSIPFGGGYSFGALPFAVVQLTANILAAPPFFGSDLDASLVAKNWSITPLDPEAHPRLVQAAELVTEDNQGAFGLPQLVLVGLPATLLKIDGVLTYGKRYRLTYDGEPWDFTAYRVAASAAPPDVRIDDGFIYDIANPFLTRDALVVPPKLGTYQVTDTGDLGTDKSGEASLRKRIVRRALSAAGSFFHLQGYGVGIELKRTITADMLRRLSARIRAQVLQEPEVQTVTVFLAQVPGASDVVSCRIDAVTSAGRVQAVVPLELP